MQTQQVDREDQAQARLEALEEVWEYIQRIDLSFFRTKLLQPRWGQPMPEKVVDHAISDYRRFLFLMRKYEDERLGPTHDIDVIWHEHILDTKPYFRDTAKLFGHYKHHAPDRTSPGERDPEVADPLQRSCELYQREFGEKLQTYFGGLSSL